FTAAHRRVPVGGVPALPFEVAEVTALRAVAEQITGRG
ncbi:ArsA family ATPase, partial [Gordonia amicalis]|nr:ArsA family ATPase [Gordonia amicalis]